MSNATVEKAKEQSNSTTMTPKAAAPISRREQYPAYPFHTLQRDMNQLFEDFARGFDMWKPKFAEPFFGDFHVKLDIKDNDNEITLTAEIPGVELKDIDLLLSDHMLTIKGEKKEEREEREKGYYRSERNYGSFQRMIPLPCEVNKDAVEATFKNGVLKVRLQKSPEYVKQTKKVEIKNG